MNIYKFNFYENVARFGKNHIQKLLVCLHYTIHGIFIYKGLLVRQISRPITKNFEFVSV